MHKNILNKILILTLLLYPEVISAYSSSYSTVNTKKSDFSFLTTIFTVGFFWFLIAVVYERLRIKKIRDNSWRHAEKQMAFSAQTDPAWNKETIIDFTKNVFNAYYSAWAYLDPSSLKKFLTVNFLKKTVLEMSVVKGLGRTFILNLKSPLEITIVSAKDVQGVMGDTFTAEIKYSFKEGTFLNPIKMLRDKKNPLSASIIEYWEFIREEDGWQLDKVWSDYFIRPNLLMSRVEENIQKFAESNGFYYDPDFGKIMLPDKGKLFIKYSNSQKVSNHTIGMWDKKILEFYIYYGCDSNGDNRTCRSYVVAQAILPKFYKNMIIESKGSDLSLFSNIGSDLEKIKTPSIDFDKKYTVYRSHNDRVNVLELLPPNFMEHLMSLNFPICLEIIDNILCISSPYNKSSFNFLNSKVNLKNLSLKNNKLPHKLINTANYEGMLKVLGWAFDEMKM